MNDDVYDEISRFDDEFTPDMGFRPGPEILPDGLVDLMILDAVPDRTFKDREAVFRLSLRTLSGPAAGTLFDLVYFLSRSESVARLGGDLVTLGFDADKWKPPQRPFSQEIKKVLVKLKGLKFRAMKETNWSEPKQRYYHNIRINSALNKDTPPLSMGGALAPAPKPPAPRAPALAGVGNGVPNAPVTPQEEGYEEIPF